MEFYEVKLKQLKLKVVDKTINFSLKIIDKLLIFVTL